MEIHQTPQPPRVGMAHGVARFGDLLRRYRVAAGLTQRELAQRAGLSLRGITALELGHRHAPRIRTVTLLADALDLSPDDRAALEAAGRQPRRPRECALVLLPSPTPATFGGVPAITAPDARPHNLPLPPTPLLGREREVTEVTALLCQEETRLVTLTGPGGVGKTRLALEVARALHHAGDVSDRFPDGIWFVRLAPLTDPALVVPSVAQALGLSERGGASIEDVLHAFLRGKSLLVLLDNFEHVPAAAPQIADLLAASAGLTLLVTSRAVLRLRGEHNYPVPLLAVPLPGSADRSSAKQLSQYAATALFLQRARAAQPRFQVTDATAPLVADICARLNGLPLAIELAAAWARLLSPAALLARLEHQLPLLAGGPVDLPERQRTMRTAIAWSYDLLGAKEQHLFRRLAVFADSWTVEAAEAVCQEPAGTAPLGLDALAGLGTLVDHSLIYQREQYGETRCDMLHVVREFALEQLEASGEAEALRRAHARSFTDLAERIEPESRGPEVQAWLLVVERELGNVRAALGWACASGEAALGLRLATALWRFWFAGGHLSEGQQWLEALLALTRPEETSIPAWLRARALADLGMLLVTQRQFSQATPYLEAGIALGREAGDWLALMVGLQFWGALLRVTGHPEQAAACFEEVLAIGRARGETLAIYTPMASLAEIAFEREDWTAATARYTEAIAISRAAGHQDHVGGTLLLLGEVALRQDDARRAAALLREAIETVQAAGPVWALPNALDLLATAYARIGQEERAAHLFGAVATQRDAVEAPYVPAQQPRIEATVASARAALSAGSWAAAFAAGRALSLEEACTEALAAPEQTNNVAAPALSPPPAPQSPRVGAERLTRREWEVLRLLAQGWTDAQIAKHLVISPRTVNHHVTSLYDKLSVSSRAAATRYALEHDLL